MPINALSPTTSPTNLSGLSSLTTTATSLSNLILAIPQIFGQGNGPQYTQGYQPGLPPNAVGVIPNVSPQLPPAILFNYEGEQTVTLESDITDHYIEDNTAIQDQISVKPEMITTHGYIGELNDIPPRALQTVRQISNAFGIVSAYVPGLSITAQLAYANAFQIYQVGQNALNAGISTWSSLNGQGGEAVVGSNGISNTFLPTQSKQQIAFQQFYGYWRNRILFTIQTPWAVFQNAAIKSLRAIQDAETEMITDFEVTFKVIRTAQTVSVPVRSGRNFTQSSPLTNLGTIAPIEGPTFGSEITRTQPNLGATG